MKRKKLTPMDVIEIRAFLAFRRELSSKALARRYGVSRSLIQSIALKRRNGLHG